MLFPEIHSDMPKVILKTDRGEQFISLKDGESLLDILNTAGFRVQSACIGNGACGLCVVQILKGEGGNLTQSELFHLDDTKIRRGFHLACQVKAKTDIKVKIINPAPPSSWKTIPENKYHFSKFKASLFNINTKVSAAEHLLKSVKQPYGIALDI